MTRKRLMKTLLTGMVVATAGLVGLAWAPSAQAAAHSDGSCSSCHVPHAAAGDNTQVPLWNPSQTTTTLTDHYSSPTLASTEVGAPDGPSKLCLSCHDGGNGYLASSHKEFVFGSKGDGTMGNLSSTHPISFTYDAALATADGGLKDPSSLAKGVLDGASKVQCTSCHDPHSTADQTSTAYLRWSYDPTSHSGSTSNFCRHCHNK